MASRSASGFPIWPRQLGDGWTFDNLKEGEHEIEGFHVLAREIPHKGGRAFGYRVDDGSSSVAYLSDHSPVAYGPGPDGYGPYHEAAVTLAAKSLDSGEAQARLERLIAVSNA